MACCESKSPDPQALLHFFTTNADQLYSDFSDRRFLKSVEVYPSADISSKESFVSEVSHWISSGDTAKAASLICLSVWSSRASEKGLTGAETLLSLLGKSPDIDFHLLRFFVYLSRRSPGLQRRLDEILDPGIEHLEQEFRSDMRTCPLSVVDMIEESTFTCFWLMHTLSSKTRFSLESVSILFQEACLMHFLPIELSTSILCFCAGNLKKCTDLTLRNPNPIISCPLTPECLELLLECLGSFQSIPSPLFLIIFDRLKVLKLKVHDEALFTFLETGESRISQFISYFQINDCSLLKSICGICERLLLRISAAKHHMKINNAVGQIVSSLDIRLLPDRHFPYFVLEKIYKRQFAVGTVSDEFSQLYLWKIAKKPNFSIEDREVETILEQQSLYTFYKSATRATGPVQDFIQRLLTHSMQERSVLSESRTKLIMKIIRSLPTLRDSILAEATRVSDQLQQALHLPGVPVSEKYANTCVAGGDILRFVIRLQDMNLDFPSFPEELRTLVSRYTTYIGYHFNAPDSKERGAIIEECRRLTPNFSLNHFDPDSLSDVETASFAVISSIAIQLRKLETRVEELLENKASEAIMQKFRQKWEGHALLLNQICEEPNVLSLAFDASQPQELRASALTGVIQAFRMKKCASTEEGRQMCYSAFVRWVIQAQITGFLSPRKREKWLISRVIKSKCLKEALCRLSLPSDHLNYFKKRVFFGNLDFNNYGRSVMLGGFIVLNERLRDGSTANDCLILVTLAHELTHLARRQVVTAQTNPSSSVVKTTEKCFFSLMEESPKRHMQTGMPEDHQNTTSEVKECGKALECVLFGSAVQQLTYAQMDFLCEKKNWKHLGVYQFRDILSGFGDSLRCDPGVYSFNRTDQCMIRD